MYIFSLYSGILYQLPDHFFSVLDDGQLPLKNKPNLCKKCCQRGYTGFNTTTYTYSICKCVEKNTDHDRIRLKYNIQSKSV